MVKNQQMNKNQQLSQNSVTDASPASRLEAFSLTFEYNKTLQEIKRDVRVRTI